MVILAHFKKSNLDLLIKELVVLKGKYAKNEYGVERELLVLIEKSEAFFKQIGKSSLESKISSLSSYVSSAIHGIDPRTLELVKSHKRRIIRSAIFYCQTELSMILENEFDSISAMLIESENSISQVVLSLLQTGRIDERSLLALNVLDEISHFWNTMVVN